MDLIPLIGGLALVLLGANGLIDGSVAIARRARVSEFVIGMTIVGIGTSVPEMVVSFTAAIEHNADISIGNILGSNTFNTFCITGFSALLVPLALTAGNRRRDIPMHLAAVAVLLLLGLDSFLYGASDSILSRWDGAVMLALFAGYMYLSFRKQTPDEDTDGKKVQPLWLAILMVLGGIAALVFGGRLFVDGARAIATHAGISDKVIAITVLAAGTSLPEFAASTVAAAKGKGQLALGNVIGSNIANILLVLGGSALIYPLHMGNPADLTSTTGINFIDLSALAGGAVALLLFAVLRAKKVSRGAGILLFLCYAAYLTWLFYHL